MGFLDRFRKKDSTLPSEVDSYYQQEKNSRRTAALLLGVATFFVTLLVGAALFFGGRAIYRAVNDDNGSSDTAQVEQNENKSESIQDPAKEAPAQTDQQEERNDRGTAGDSTSEQPNTGDQPATPDLGDQTSLPATGDPGM